MNGCKEPLNHDWHMGESFISMARNSFSTEVYLEAPFVEFVSTEEVVCFEDIYISGRVDYMLRGQHNSIQFRSILSSFLASSAPAKELFSMPETALQYPNSGLRLEHCMLGNARIVVLRKKDVFVLCSVLQRQ